MKAVIIAVVAFAACASAVGVGVGVAHDIYAYPAYKYSYGVADKLTGDQKSAVEVRDGGVTKGSYSLLQPDGVIRTVNYIATPHGGFQAQVINKGAAGHPAIYGIGKGVVGGLAHGVGVAGVGHLGGIGAYGAGHLGGVGHLGAGHLGVGHLGGIGAYGAGIIG